MAPQLSEAWIEIGRIVAPQGLGGEMRVYPDSDFPERFLVPGQRWLLRPGSGQPEAVVLESGRFLEGKGLYVIRLEGITSREQSELLRGARLMVQTGDRPPLAEGEFHLMDLVGLTVVNAYTQDTIGTVIGIANAGNDLLEIQPTQVSAQNILVPLVKTFVKSIDFQAKRLELMPIPGLLPDAS